MLRTDGTRAYRPEARASDAASTHRADGNRATAVSVLARDSWQHVAVTVDRAALPLPLVSFYLRWRTSSAAPANHMRRGAHHARLNV
jgi:hypothetical protein